MNRNLQVKQLPCIACTIYGVFNQPFPTESHHLNFDGKAGQKRRGDDYSIPLCSWHHSGRIEPYINSKAMAALYGPSLAKQSKAFRLVFGSDDELLEKTNEQLRAA